MDQSHTLLLLIGTAALLLLGAVWLWRTRRRRRALDAATAERPRLLASPPQSGATARRALDPSVPSGPSDAPQSAGEAEPSDLPSRPRLPEGGAVAPLVLVDRTEPRHTLVFAHGFLGGDRVGPPVLSQPYFRGVAEQMRRAGYQAHFVRVSPTASIERRALQLATQIDRLGTQVNIIAHSMGGLDARYAIALLGLDRSVASLTTIGTPHHGTPLADVAVSMLGSWRRTRQALDMAGLNVDGLFDLTTERMERFNALVVDDDRVAYRSYVGRVTTGPGDVHALLAPGYTYLRRAAGDNDGIVPAGSQRWGETFGELDADHWAQIGWSGRFDAGAFYRSVVEDLVRARL